MVDRSSAEVNKRTNVRFTRQQNTITTYDPRAEEGLDFHDYLCQVARDTGRVIFGQLWVTDPTVGDILHAIYQPAIADAVNYPNPLKSIFK